MNSHLNIFKAYTNTTRKYQLENDLTRALAISLQEDSLFFHEILKEVFFGTKFYSQLFDSMENETTISIDIQQKTSQISDYEHIFAITLSEAEISDFWGAKHEKNYDPICDLVIKINNIYLIIEAKRDNTDCTSQLYNQIFNIVRSSEDEIITTLDKDKYSSKITPFDLNWAKLMAIAVRALSFEKSYGNTNRFLSDFVSLVREHNYKWLPEAPINSLQSNNQYLILRRVDSAIIEASKSNGNIIKLPYADRLGISFHKQWAQEIIFRVNENGDLTTSVYPGNTKQQGHSLFKTNPMFSNVIEVLGKEYPVSKGYHIKFSSQSYITELNFSDNQLKNELYTTVNFHKFTGRNKQGKDWDDIEKLFDHSLEFDWRSQCKWNERIISTNRTQFNISFGYHIVVIIPFKKLKEIDTNQLDLTNLAKLVADIYEQYNNKLLTTNV